MRYFNFCLKFLKIQRHRQLSLTGFTLMELLIVVIIVAILVTIALPLYDKTLETSRISEAYVQLAAIKDAESAYYTKYYRYATSLNDLTASNPDDISAATRYFDYSGNSDNIALTGSGFILKCYRNQNKNTLNVSYYVSMNQDGVIYNNFK